VKPGHYYYVQGTVKPEQKAGPKHSNVAGSESWCKGHDQEHIGGTVSRE
jgi:hypothetical protein